MFTANLKQIQKSVGNGKRREPIIAQSYPYQYDSVGSFRFAEESHNNLNSSYTRHLKFRQNHSALACHAMNYVTNERWLRREVKDLLGLRKFSNNLIVKAESKDIEISKLSRLLKGNVEQHKAKTDFERPKSRLTSYDSDNGYKNDDHDDGETKQNMALNLFKVAKSETRSINSNIDHKNHSRKTHSKEDLIDFKNELSVSRSLSVLSNQGENRNNEITNNNNNSNSSNLNKHSANKTRANETSTNASAIKPINDLKETDSEFYSSSYSNKSQHDSHSTNSMLPPLKKSNKQNAATNTGKKKLKKIYNPDIRNHFVHKVRLVIALIKIVEFALNKAKDRRQYLKMNNKFDTISAIVEDIKSGESNRVLFDKNAFKAKKNTEIGRELQFILTIPPESRTQEQINLARIGLSNVESFNDYPLSMQEKICKCAFYQKVSVNKVVIRQSQIADNFYFIISGQAIVSVLNNGESKIVAVLKEGTCFGELAFLYNSTRTATVSSLTPLELLSISREDFYEIFVSNKGDVPDHIKYLKSIWFFKDWPIQVLIDHPSNCLFHYYKKGQVIVHDSGKCDYIYIVKTGSCQVLKKVNQVKAKKTPTKDSQNKLSSSKEVLLYDVYKSKVSFPKINKERTELFRSNTLMDLSEREKKSVTKPVFLQVQLLKSGDTFGLGLLDLNNDNIANPELSLVSNGAEVLMVKKDVFLNNASQKVIDNIRRTVQPYPQTEYMQSKLQNSADWSFFKTVLLKDVYKNLKIES